MVFLARILGTLYIINNVNDDTIRSRGAKRLTFSTPFFLVFFLAFLVYTLQKDGYAYDPTTGVIFMEPTKYLNNFLEMWYLLVILLAGVALVLYGIIRTLLSVHRKLYTGGIWPVGIGTVLTVLALLVSVGWNNTAYYPSNADLQSSLTIANSCSSEFTLRTMAVVSLLIPLVLAYIIHAWRKIDSRKIDRDDILHGEAY